MKTYHVTVNGTTYEVKVSEVAEGTPAPAVAPAAAPAPVAAAPAVAAPAPAPAASSGEGEKIASPMPGTILSVNVTAGQSVKSGDVLMILEAMKMENEIMAPKDGVVTSVAVTAGSTVESGTLLCTIA